jgi:hypothetical protein
MASKAQILHPDDLPLEPPLSCLTIRTISGCIGSAS